MRFFLVCAIIIAGLSPSVTTAAVSALTPFGGTVIMTIPCTCQVSGSAVYVSLVTPPYFGMFLWQPPVTIPYLWYYPYSGVKVLGNYVSGATCMVYAGISCVSIPVSGTITQIGSSLR